MIEISEWIQNRNIRIISQFVVKICFQLSMVHSRCLKEHLKLLTSYSVSANNLKTIHNKSNVPICEKSSYSSLKKYTYRNQVEGSRGNLFKN